MYNRASKVNYKISNEAYYYYNNITTKLSHILTINNMVFGMRYSSQDRQQKFRVTPRQ